MKSFYNYCGHSWFSADAVFAAYNHVLVPNSPNISLVSNPSGYRVNEVLGYVIGASSYHQNLVNIRRGDGSTDSVSDAIDPELWGDISKAN